MITKVLPLQFLKKSPFFGSDGSMRYRLIKEGDELQVCVFPGPFGFDAADDGVKEYFRFPFSEEGYTDAVELLNRLKEDRDWESLELPW